MKRLDRLQALVQKLTQKEINQFKRYCEYKLKRKALRLFNLIIKHKDEPTFERLEIDLKRNKLQPNLRFSVNELFELILSFWDDSIVDGDRIRTVNQMIDKARILSRKGLRQESITLLEKVVKETEHTVNIEQTLLVNRVLYAERAIFGQKNSIQQSAEFVENQLHLTKQINTFNQCSSLYYDGMYLYSKGLEMLEKDEVHQLLDIREKGKEIIENSELPTFVSIQLGSLLSILYTHLAPSNFQLVEHFHRHNLKRVEELDDTFNRPTYYSLLYGYLNFLACTHRIEDYKASYKKLLEAKAKTKSIDVAVSGIIQVLALVHCILEYEAEKTDETIFNALEYVKTHSLEVNPSIIRSLLFVCFELAIVKGDFELADQFIEQLEEGKLVQKHKKQFKLTLRIASLLLHYEKNNYQWILNQSESIKRLFSGHLKKNIGAKLLLKLLVQLSSTTSKKEKLTLLANFLEDLSNCFEKNPEQRFTFFFNIIEDWAEAKLNGCISISEFKK